MSDFNTFEFVVDERPEGKRKLIKFLGRFALLPFLEQCRREGYAHRSANGSWHLTARGALLSNPIIVSLTELL